MEMKRVGPRIPPSGASPPFVGDVVGVEIGSPPGGVVGVGVGPSEAGSVGVGVGVRLPSPPVAQLGSKLGSVLFS